MNLRYGLLAGSLLTASVTLGSVLVSAPVFAQPVQGLYMSGEGGASFNQGQVVRHSSARDEFHPGATGIGSIGWGLGNGFRVEVEGHYRNNDLKTVGGNAAYHAHADGRQQESGIMANALFDLDIGKSWLFPYFGAGIGYGSQTMNATMTGNVNGQNYSQHVGSTYGNFAYQGIFGLAFPMPWVVGLSATAEYRFWTMLGPQSHSSIVTGSATALSAMNSDYGFRNGNRDTRPDFTHSLMLGLRYEFNPAPPPPPPPPTIAAPAPAENRTYLVFFDWDRSDLTERARSIVAVAAQASTNTQTTRIEVNGYTDNSAAHPGRRGEEYNQALSLRRAQTIKAELVRDGVPGPSIDIHGYGDSNPLVQTAANTREAQNRRVEIILH